MNDVEVAMAGIVRRQLQLGLQLQPQLGKKSELKLPALGRRKRPAQRYQLKLQLKFKLNFDRE